MHATRMTERFVEAVEYAARAHDGHVRKGTSVPYFSHLLAVAALVLEDGGSETEAIAGLLHDVVEDRGGHERLLDVRARFGADVAALVEACTDYDVAGERGPWRERKEAYVRRIAAMPATVRRISLADKVHNAQAILRDYRSHGEALWQRFNAGRDGQLWYLRAVADAFARTSTSPLVADLEAAVGELEARATDGA